MSAIAKLAVLVGAAVFGLEAAAQDPPACTTVSLDQHTDLVVPDGFDPDAPSPALVFHLHGSRALARDAFVALGRRNAVLLAMHLPGLSKIYGDRFAAPSAFATLRERATAAAREATGRGDLGFEQVLLSGFSAGYGGIRAILRDGDRRAIDAVVLGDGLHASLTDEGLPRRQQMAPFVAFARDAVQGRVRFLFSHSEIDPVTYASTTKCADAVLAAVGVAREVWKGSDGEHLPRRTRGRCRGLDVRGFGGETGADHVAHFRYLWRMVDEALAGMELSYLDQPPPGDRPVLFAPDIIRTPPGVHSAAIFSPDGRTMLWSPMARGSETRMMSRVDGAWTGPRVVDFGMKAGIGDPFFAPDGERLYFLSFETTDAHPVARERIWFVERDDEVWGAPRLVDDVVVAHPTHWQFSVAANGNLYFTSELRGGQDIYVARYQDGRFLEPEDLGPKVNSEARDLTPFVAPDESYLLFARAGAGDAALWASFRDEAGGWTPAIPLGDRVDTDGHELCPVVSPDGRYLFFTGRVGQGYGVYWIDASFLEGLRASATSARRRR